VQVGQQGPTHQRPTRFSLQANPKGWQEPSEMKGAPN
jgi:hypothetical protein